MEQYFNLKYEFDKKEVWVAIDRQLEIGKTDYISVADGVILNIANRQPEYMKVINDGMFAICDSSYVPLYLKWIYGIKRQQYCGSQIFMDIVNMKRYRMFFMGTSNDILEGLKNNISQIDLKIKDMTFYELPFCKVDEFDYKAIADMVNKDGADIIWVALGAPKQEIFMSKLKPYLKRGVMIAVGAVFKFYSGGVDVKRAPEWMVKAHLEFVYRIFSEPKKQIGRCAWIVRTLPRVLIGEIKRKRKLKSKV